MHTRQQTLRLLLMLLLTAGVFACLFSVFLPPSASLLAPTATPTPTATHAPTATFTPGPADFMTPYPNLFMRGEYFQRDSWESAVGGKFLVEDFENDLSGRGNLHLPYLTGNKLMLGGKSSAEIIRSPQLLETGNLLRVRDWEQGLTLTLPDGITVIAFGFDYTSSREGLLTIVPKDFEVTLLSGRNRFVGVIVNQDFPKVFTLSSSTYAQDGLTIDNISYVPYIP